MTRAARIIEFIERYCLVPDGAQVGQPLVLEGNLESLFLALTDQLGKELS